MFRWLVEKQKLFHIFFTRSSWHNQNTGEMNGDTRQYSAIAQVPRVGFAYYLIKLLVSRYYINTAYREGRLIIVDIKTEDRIITLVNIYAPNHDEPDFFFQKVRIALLILHVKI